jgi:hypothetical protein
VFRHVWAITDDEQAQTTLHEMGMYLDPCEISGLTDAAIAACDPLDGVVDGLISDPDSCKFDPFTMVGKKVSCGGLQPVYISHNAAKLAYDFWNGMKKSKQPFMYRPANYEAPLVSSGNPLVLGVMGLANVTLGLADRVCQMNGTCTGKGFKMVDDWIKLYLRKDPNYDVSKILQPEFDELMEISTREYTKVIGTNQTDLRHLRDAGTKLISYHGLVSEELL